MLRLTLFTLLTCVVYAQNPADLFNKPPADVDQALRARITEFYQYHVKQEFRKAEGLVAEDTKDFFYSHNKPQYLSFEIVRIEYSQNFTQAKATLLVEVYIMAPGFADKPIKAPIPSTWKLEGGKWFWYVDQEALRETPFGKMTPGPGAPGGLPTVLPSVESVLNRIKPDKSGVALKAGESTDVKFTNTAPGQMDLTVMGAPEGIEAKFDKPRLAANDISVLAVKAGKNAKSGVIDVRVEQTLELIAIQVSVK